MPANEHSISFLDDIVLHADTVHQNNLKQALRDLQFIKPMTAGILCTENYQRADYASQSMMIWCRLFDECSHVKYRLDYLLRTVDQPVWQPNQIWDLPGYRSTARFDRVPTDQDIHEFNQQVRIGESFIKQHANSDEQWTYKVCHEGWNGLRGYRRRRETYPVQAQIAAILIEDADTYQVGEYLDVKRFRQDMRAIATARTWGELYDQLSIDTLESLEELFSAPEFEEDLIDPNAPGLLPRDWHFQMWDFPNFEEGEYPQLLSNERDVLPRAIIKEFFMDTMNEYIGLQEERLFEFAATVEDRGYCFESWSSRD